VLLRADEVMSDVVADFRTPAAVHGRFVSWQRSESAERERGRGGQIERDDLSLRR
jgi:hypothetical protein